MLILKRPWTRQPQTVVGVNSNHSLRRGLKVAMIGGQLWNAVDGAVGTKRTEPSSVGVSANGKHWNFAATATNTSRGIELPFNVSGALTVHAIARRNASVNDADSSRVSAIVSNLNNGQPNFWTLNLGNGYGAGVEDDYPRFSTAGAGVGTIYLNGVAMSGNNPGGTPLSNGVWYRVSAAKPAGSTDTEASNKLIIGCECVVANTIEFGLNGDIAAIFVWDRELSATEIARLTYLEWDLFAPRRIIVPYASAATVPTLSNLSARLITSSSAQPQIDYTF